MDHLILPEATEQWIQVAYDCPKPGYYEELMSASQHGYVDFYKERNWAHHEVWAQPHQDVDDFGGVVESEERKKKKSWHEIETFFQTWLLFGLIIEVFRIVGITTETEEFLEQIDQKSLSTSPDADPNDPNTVGKPRTTRSVKTDKLPTLIKQWRDKYYTVHNNEIYEQIMKLVDFVGSIVDYHCAGGKDHRSIHQYGKVLWSVTEGTTTAIIAVASTIRKAAFAIHQKKGKEERWPVTNSRLLYHRILRKACRADTAMIMEDFDIDGQYYIAAAKGRTLKELDSHYACTDHSCEAKVPDGTYITRHDDECSVKDDYDPVPRYIEHVYPDYSPPPASLRDAVKRAIDANHLPVLRWDSVERGLRTYGFKQDSYSEDSSKAPPFVAISHVWADGKGNPFDNSLPYCQIDRIQKLVDELCEKHLPSERRHSSPGFWMDTLCCLVGNDPTTKAYKKKSIASMRLIYGSSVAVLIVDPWLMSISSTTSTSELCYRIYASGWSRRLWTHQEGFLARDVYYQLRDKPVRLPDVDLLARKYQGEMLAQGRVVTFPLQASGKSSFYYTTIKTLVNSIQDGNLGQDSKWMLYQPLADSLGYRSTTNIDDELLCVASVIGSDVSHYAKLDEIVQDREALAEERMKEFLLEMGRVRQGIIFNSYKRLSIPGFRWAPKSLIGHRSSGLGDVRDSKDSRIEDYSHLNLNDVHVEVGPLNTKVNLNKYVPKLLGVDRQALSVILNDKTILLPTRGLPVDYPGYEVRFTAKSHGMTVNMAERRFGLCFSPLPPVAAAILKPSLPKVPSFGKVPTIGLGRFGSSSKAAPPAVEGAEQSPPAETAAEELFYKYVVFVAENDVDWRYERDYVVILQHPLGANAPQEILAMIGRKSVGPGKRYWVQSLCSALVRAKRRSDDPKVDAGIDFIDVSQPKTNWVVT